MVAEKAFGALTWSQKVAEWNKVVPYFELVIAFSLVVYLLETYLSYRQHKTYSITKRPRVLEQLVTEEQFKQSQAYGKDKSRFGFLASAWNEGQSVLLLVFGLFPIFWAWSEKLIERWGYTANNEIIHSLVFFTVYSLVSTIIDLPLAWYSTFVLEHKHGFNKSTIGLFLVDKVKEFVISAVISNFVLAALLEIIARTGDSFYFYVWLFCGVFVLVMTTLYPVLIQPLFNKVTPLEEGELRTKIEQLAARLKFPLTKLYVIDGSKRSAHSNAYFYGFFNNKRIVLYDTLLKQATNDELCAVLAHELGHWAMNHVLQTLIVLQLQIFTMFWLFSHFINNAPFYANFGFLPSGDGGRLPVLIGLILFGYVFTPVNHLLTWIMNLLTRMKEFQADAFAFNLGYGTLLRSALTKLQVENKSSMIPDSWYSTYAYTHPPLVERLAALDALEGKRK